MGKVMLVTFALTGSGLSYAFWGHESFWAILICFTILLWPVVYFYGCVLTGHFEDWHSDGSKGGTP